MQAAAPTGGLAGSLANEELDGMRGAIRAKGCLDLVEHHVADVTAADPSAGDVDVGNGLAVEGVNEKGDADLLAVPAADLQRIRAPWP